MQPAYAEESRAEQNRVLTKNLLSPSKKVLR
jgi:hypothetical protein